MINKREVRISIFYLTLILAMVFSIWAMMITGFVNKDSGTMFNVLTGILMAFLFLAPIVCLIAVIFHMVKAFRFSRKIKGKKQDIIWKYDNVLWRSFIKFNFQLNVGDDLKSFGKFGIKFIPVALIGIIITIALNPIRVEYALISLSIPFGIFLTYFLWVMGRNVLKALDHLLFSDNKVVLMKSEAIFNEEYINWDMPGESKLIEKNIEGRYIEIKYCVRARSNWNFESNKDVKRLRIPIPTGKYDEAESFICKINKVNKS